MYLETVCFFSRFLVSSGDVGLRGRASAHVRVFATSPGSNPAARTARARPVPSPRLLQRPATASQSSPCPGQQPATPRTKRRAPQPRRSRSGRTASFGTSGRLGRRSAPRCTTASQRSGSGLRRTGRRRLGTCYCRGTGSPAMMPRATLQTFLGRKLANRCGRTADSYLDSQKLRWTPAQS